MISQSAQGKEPACECLQGHGGGGGGGGDLTPERTILELTCSQWRVPFPHTPLLLYSDTAGERGRGRRGRTCPHVHCRFLSHLQVRPEGVGKRY